MGNNNVESETKDNIYESDDKFSVEDDIIRPQIFRDDGNYSKVKPQIYHDMEDNRRNCNKNFPQAFHNIDDEKRSCVNTTNQQQDITHRNRIMPPMQNAQKQDYNMNPYVPKTRDIKESTLAPNIVHTNKFAK